MYKWKIIIYLGTYIYLKRVQESERIINITKYDYDDYATMIEIEPRGSVLIRLAMTSRPDVPCRR